MEHASEQSSIFAINRFFKRHGGETANLAMEEARTYRSVDFHHGRNPWRIAQRCMRWKLAQVFAEAARDTVELFGRLNNELRMNVFVMFANQLFNFRFQRRNFAW